MLITMFTDAGFNSDLKVASWAVWAKENGMTFRYSGMLKGNVEDNNIAELKAIINGLFFVLKRLNPPQNSRIIVQTDSAISINIFRRNFDIKSKSRVKQIADEWQKLIGESKITVEFRHVKAHKGYKDARSAVNSWCDKQCRTLLENYVKAGCVVMSEDLFAVP